MEHWEDFAAFGDIGELEHVCYLLEEEAKVAARLSPAECMTGEGSHLSKQLVRQARESRAVIEREHPGLYDRTWIAELFERLYRRLDEVTEFPSRLAGELRDIELDLHKVMIAAHDVFDQEHRAAMVAKAVAAASREKQKAIASKSRPNRRSSETSGKVLVAVVKTESKKQKWNTGWDWLVSAAEARKSVGKFQLDDVNDGVVSYTAAGKDTTMKRETFQRYWNTAEK